MKVPSLTRRNSGQPKPKGRKREVKEVVKVEQVVKKGRGRPSKKS